MKFKDIFPVICLLLLIVSDLFLFAANKSKSLAQQQLATTRQQVQDLQTQLSNATNDIAYADAQELTRLRADNQDLPRLRDQITQLQAANHKLSEQLGRTRYTAAQQQQQMEEMQAESDQAVADQQAAVEAAAQMVAKHRESCIANLRLIYLAKQAWALEKVKTDTDVPTEQDLLPYLKGGVFPICPSGGVYTIGAVGQLPTCTIPGHVLPSQ